jgi:hypothetical protein
VTVLFCGVGLVAAALAVIVFRSIAGGIVVNALVKEESVKPAAEAAWSIGTSLMVSIATTLVAIGILCGLAGWLASPTATARGARQAVAPVRRERAAYVYAALAVLVSLYFLSAPTQNLRSFLTTLVIACFIAVGIHELRKQTAQEFPDASFEDAFGRTRDRVVEAVKSAEIGDRVSRLRLPEVRVPGRPEADATDAAPSSPPPDADDARLARLERLGELREKGVLTEDEFKAEKARILA